MGEEADMLAYLDCFSGISGDMLLGAMVDAGLDLATLRARLAALPLSGYALDAERITSQGITGTRLHVRIAGEGEHRHRGLREIRALIEAARFAPALTDRMLAVFSRLAEAEGAIHGVAPDEVTFHEVGAVDSIVDIVGTVLGLDLLGIGPDALYCSELPLTSGRVRSAHGPLPVPAPATLALLQGTEAVWRPIPGEGELVTPTGAAVVASLARFARPTLRVRRVGYGFGSKTLPWANCLRLVLGEAVPAAGSPSVFSVAPAVEQFERDEIVILESNIDTMTGEALGWLMERLLAAGALDVSYSPLQMKKNRPGTLLRVLAPTAQAADLAALIVREAETLGVRVLRAERLKAGRRVEEIETPLGRARVKLKLIGGHIAGVSAEYDDCQALARAHALPLETARASILRAAHARFDLPGAAATAETPHNEPGATGAAHDAPPGVPPGVPLPDQPVARPPTRRAPRAKRQQAP